LDYRKTGGMEEAEEQVWSMIYTSEATIEAYFDDHDLMWEGASAAPISLLVLPHFSCSSTPTFDTASKATIFSLTFATNHTDIARAIPEGLMYELRPNLDLLKAGGVQIDMLHSIGGGSKSSLWLQLKADITDIPVVVPRRIIEATGFGETLLAAVGMGIFPSAVGAAERFCN
jgi:xylulokinase